MKRSLGVPGELREDSNGGKALIHMGLGAWEHFPYNPSRMCAR